MANGYFERGEVYWVKMGTGVGVEMNVTRPALIVSVNHLNNTTDTLLMVFLTTKEHKVSWDRVSTFATGRESWVLCDQIQTVDKSRLTKHLGTLNAAEMRQVDDCLEEVFDLGYADTAALAEKDREIEARDAVIAEKDDEIVRLKAQLEANMITQQSRDDGYRIEIAMWQRLYEKALNQVVDMKYTNDLFLKNHLGRAEQVIVDAPKSPEMPPKSPESPPKNDDNTPVEENRLDINNCTITALKKLGFSMALAKTIVSRRPYKMVSDLKTVPGMKSTLYQIMEPKLCCTPVVKKKKTVIALVEPDTGYESEETPVVVEAVATPEAVKVNVNTAKAEEISKVTGMNLVSCYAITGKRKREGLYTSLEQLVIPGRVSDKMLAKCRDKLEL